MPVRINPETKVLRYRMKQNKYFPNSTFPILIYKEAIQLPFFKKNAATVAKNILFKNNWKNSWVNGIYNFHHFHSLVHECIIVLSGKVSVIFGGPGGRRIKLNRNDVVIIPAGVAHKCIDASLNFSCLGAYPEGKDFDIKTGIVSEFEYAIKNIKRVPVPKLDPVFGTHGFIKRYWNK